MTKIIIAALLYIWGLMMLHTQNKASSQVVMETNNGEFNDPVGFASLEGGTTGGEGGNSIIVTKAQQLADIMKARENKNTDPLILYISGTLTGYTDMLDVKRTANISILGIGDNARLEGFGLKIVECSNIIVRNLTFANCTIEEKDAMNVNESHNIWLDHCTFTDSPSDDPEGIDHDGLLDIKNGSYNVTVSYNYFTNHRKTCLLGHTESQTSDSVMKVTYYHNWFDGTFSRHPRIRFAKVHILNNLYSNVGQPTPTTPSSYGYGIGVTCEAQVFVEANYFENTKTPILISQINDPGKTLSGDPAGYISAEHNYLINSGQIVENLDGFNFDPRLNYNYTAADSYLVKELVMANAGAGKMDINTHIGSETILLPKAFKLCQNYPNPFNLETRIDYTVPNILPVKLEVYNVLGQRVATLVNEIKPAGLYQVTFDGSKLSSGVYLYQLSTYTQVIINKMILLK